MADYYPLIAKAIAGLEKSTGETRRALYDRARTALLGQLRGVEPELSEAEITHERLALEEAVRKVEAEIAQARYSVRQPRRTEYREAPPAAPEQGHFSEEQQPIYRPASRPPADRDEDHAQVVEEVEEELSAVKMYAGTNTRVASEAPRGGERWSAGGAALSESETRSYQDNSAGARSKEPAAAHAAAVPQYDDPGRGAEKKPWVRGKSSAKPAQKPRPDSSRRGRPGMADPLPSIVRPEVAGKFASHEDGPYGGESRRPPRSARSAQRQTNRIVAIVIMTVMALALAGGGAWLAFDRLSNQQGAPSDVARTDQKAGDHPTSSTSLNSPTQKAGKDDSRPDEVGAPAASAMQKVVLYEEEPANPNGTQFVGTANWHVDQLPGQNPDAVIRCDIEIPDQKMSVHLSLRRNDDKQLQASHTVEIVFTLPPDFAHNGIQSIPGIMVKQGEMNRGTALNGVAVKVTDNYFLVGLSSLDAEMQRNIQLLKERSWFDIPIVYSDGKRALIAIEKGPPGERAFAEAFAAWQQP